jgi:hypothetical protein
MRDAAADIGRRTWTECPRCADHMACTACDEGRSCETHWRYLLAAEGRRLFVQCRSCWHRWWYDTGFGAGNRPADVDEMDDFPTPRQAAA